jgi:hypothetical protein
MKKFLHTSDLHFGAGRRLTPKSLEYLERHSRHLDRLLDLAEKEKVDGILVAGDLFESASTTVDEFLACYKFFKRAGEIAPTIGTAGNHDETQKGYFQTHRLSLMALPGVTFVDCATSLEIAGVRILACPWKGIKNQEEFDAWLKSNYTGEAIVMLHECFLGSGTDTGYTATSGVKVPDIEGVRYFACGDIHKYQRLHLAHAYFSGAPLQYNFGDKPGKGAILLDVHSEYDFRPRFVKLPSDCELKVAFSLDEVPLDSPHWYQLRVPANQVPSSLPSQVKSMQLLPTQVEIPQWKESDDVKELPKMEVDYTIGVEDFLTSARYEPEEITSVLTEIRSLV